MDRVDIAILFSGGTDSVSLYALCMKGMMPGIPKAKRVHLLHMLNGFSRFHDFPKNRLEVVKRILLSQIPDNPPETHYIELDVGRLFQGLWLDRYEELMPMFGGKNLVCVACKLAMHTASILYCTENLVSLLLVGYAKKQNYFPEQTPVFMEKIREFSLKYGIDCRFPFYDIFDSDTVTRHFLEDLGLPSTGGGERKCLFCQTLTTATEKEIAAYVDYMLPRLAEYIDHKTHGRFREASMVFPPGR